MTIEIQFIFIKIIFIQENIKLLNPFKRTASPCGFFPPYNRWSILNNPISFDPVYLSQNQPSFFRYINHKNRFFFISDFFSFFSPSSYIDLFNKISTSLKFIKSYKEKNDRNQIWKGSCFNFGLNPRVCL